MNTPVLRSLAKAYSENLIDRQKYIRERRKLIDAIVAGEVELVAYVPPTPPPLVDNGSEDAGDTIELAQETIAVAMAAEPDEVDTESAPDTPRYRAAIAAIIFIALALAALVAWRIFDKAPSPPIEVPESVASPQPDTHAETLLLAFANDTQWQPADIANFMTDWQAQPENERTALSDSTAMRIVRDAITQKYLQENALLELEYSEDALLSQRRLLDLAALLGLERTRYQRYEADWAAKSAAGRNVAKKQLQSDPNVDSAAAPDPLAAAAGAPTTDDAPDADTATAPPPADMPPIETPEEPVEAAASESTERAPALPSNESSAAEITAREPAQLADRIETTSTGVPTVAAVPRQTQSADTDPSSREALASRTPKSSACRAALAKQRRPYCRDTLRGGAKGPRMVVVPAGSFTLGGTKPEELPRQTVTIDKPFAIGVYEVSAAEFQEFCKATKSACPAQPWQDASLPVVNIAWTDAEAYARWLSEVSGATYRLPTESEWEYATRAGSDTAYPFGEEVLPTHARFSFRANERKPLAAADRSVNRNHYRLFHTIGNVREWVADPWQADHHGRPTDGTIRAGDSPLRAARGGAYSDGADDVRSASRVALAKDRGDQKTGLRIVRDVD